jgi:hypothetical protein
VTGPEATPVAWTGPGDRAILDTCKHTGLIGFDVETASRFVRPELLRLLKRGNTTTANEQYALAA